MQCEKCKSEDTKRLQVVFESGTKSIDTIGISDDGDTSSTFGFSQSLLAEKAAPPVRKIPIVSVFFACVAFSLWVIVDWAAPALFGTVLAICAIVIIYSIIYSVSEWPRQYQEWKTKWLCLKCGHIYRVDP